MCLGQRSFSDVPDLDGLDLVLTGLNVDVDGKVSIYVSHLVLVALGDTNDQVVDERLDGSESGDVLSGTMMDGELDDL